MKKLIAILLTAMMLAPPVMSLAEDNSNNIKVEKFANILVIWAIVLLVLALFIAFYLYFKMDKKHKKRLNEREEQFKGKMKEMTGHNCRRETVEENILSEEKQPLDEYPLLEETQSQELSSTDTSMFKLLADRNYTYIMNYYLYQIIGKVCEILSIIFSVISLCLSLVNDYGPQTLSHYFRLPIALLSIAFIIVVVYLAPSKRMAEQLDAWRKSEVIINKILVGSKDLSCIPDVLEECESMLSTDKS